MSKSGKACCRVFDPNSAAAKEKRAAKAAARRSQVTCLSKEVAPIYYMTARVAFKKKEGCTRACCVDSVCLRQPLPNDIPQL